jgi:hypothetical protein|tara:strand:- start:1438 stop:1665 length:228 start_codon:yes stop_codon:yes gene_type:complete
MDTLNFDTILETKKAELMELYENKMSKNKKMTSDPSQIDFNSKKLYYRINAEIDKKFKNSKAYQKMCENEQQNPI